MVQGLVQVKELVYVSDACECVGQESANGPDACIG